MLCVEKQKEFGTMHENNKIFTLLLTSDPELGNGVAPKLNSFTYTKLLLRPNKFAF